MATNATAATVTKSCIDRLLPSELLFQASRAALAENPANAPALRRGVPLPGAALVGVALLLPGWLPVWLS